VVFTLQYAENDSFSSTSGSPGGYSSSPGDGSKTCAYCGAHGPSSTVTGWLNTNIPGTGYVPGTLYQISCTVTGTGEKGFEVTCENTSNVKKGVWTAGTGSKLVNISHAVTQSSAPTTNPKTWTFGWTAPAAGTGTVKFYGCFDFGANTRHENITVSENTSAIEENCIDQLSVFPNPASDYFEVNYTLTENTPVTATLFDVTGKKSFLLMNETEAVGAHKHTFNTNSYSKGIYFLIIQTNKGETHQKLIIN
jgi:hypothetical protein